MRERLKIALPVVLLAIIGSAASLAIEVVHRRVAADVSYVSFCNLGGTVNCDVVLGSRYATLAGLSVALWALLFYLVVGATAAATPWVASAKMRNRLGQAVLLMATWGMLFAAYMAAVALFVLHAVCLMCVVLYVTNILLLVGAWRLRTVLRLDRRPHPHAHLRVLLSAALAAVVVAAVIGGWQTVKYNVRPRDATTIAQQRPDFYRWYVAQPVVSVPVSDKHVRGAPGAPVTLVLFSDFECQHCAKFRRTLDEVLRRAASGVRVIFRHFPLDQACNAAVRKPLHREACAAAIASECAAQQGKFWQYHDVLFENQRQLERAALIKYARSIDLDTGAFATCLDDASARMRVERDAREGATLGVDSTPTLFINGRLIKGALDYELLRDALTLARADVQTAR